MPGFFCLFAFGLYTLTQMVNCSNLGFFFFGWGAVWVIHLDQVPILMSGIWGFWVMLCLIMLKNEFWSNQWCKHIKSDWTLSFWRPWWWDAKNMSFLLPWFQQDSFFCCNTLITAPFHVVDSGIIPLFVGLLVLLKSSSWHEEYMENKNRTPFIPWLTFKGF